MSLQRPEKMEDVVLVTHKSCMDGSGCAVMFLRAGGKRENIRYVPAGMLERFVKDDPTFSSDSFLIFADIGFNVARYDEELDKRGNCVMLDHHKTSMHSQGRDWAHIDMSACGTELTRRYLDVDDMSAMALSTVIDDHDRWLNKVPESHDLAMLSVFLGQERFVDRFAYRTIVQNIFTPSELELLETLKARRDEAIDTACRHVMRREVFVKDNLYRIAYVVTDDPHTSLMLNEVLVRFPDVDVACQVMVGPGKVSMRSRGNVDVSAIAQCFGGGGHAAAAGHLVPRSLVDELISEIHHA